MKQKDREILENEIKSLISKLESEIADLEDSAAPVAPENSIGRISRMDAINNKSVLEASLRNRKKKLSRLQLSLSKVYEPGFGVCVQCKQNINPKRLMLVPESDKCVHCA